MNSLFGITIGVTSFLRKGYLEECVRQIDAFFPECHVIVADDSDEVDPPKPIQYGIPYRSGHRTDRYLTVQLPFDSGLSMKRNIIVKACRTPLMLLWCDDFKADAKAREGVLQMLKVLDENPVVDVAAARVDHKKYEAWLRYVPGVYNISGHVREERVEELDREYYRVDLAANYFLARTASIIDVPWEERCKIGGEHGEWFIRMKQKGRVTVLVRGANVNTLQLPDSAKDPRYDQFRGRALTQGHQVMKQVLGIKSYFGMAGDIS